MEEVKIVLVEDDPGHSRLIEKNLVRSKITNDVVKFSDGQQAIDYLFNENNSFNAESGIKHLVLLDLNLPVVDGYQILKRMKSEEKTKNIPVIILTTTNDPREVSKCYDLGCNVYISKPLNYEQFSEAIQKLGLFLSIVTVPEEGKIYADY